MNGLNVLVVDDTPDCLTVFRGILEANGCRVRTAANGHEALAEIDAQPPDIVLLDVMMPDMSGIEVLARLRADHATARIPVMLVTARTDDDDVLSGYQHGADYYITKPCTARQLLRGIALVFGENEKRQAKAGADAAAAAAS